MWKKLSSQTETEIMSSIVRSTLRMKVKVLTNMLTNSVSFIGSDSCVTSFADYSAYSHCFLWFLFRAHETKEPMKRVNRIRICSAT